MADEVPQNHEVSQFVKLGKELLEATERPNIITLAQFEPYVQIFCPDQKRMQNDMAYIQSMRNLMNDYRVKLGINIYYPTLVVDQMEEPRKVLLFLDRWFSKIQSDYVPSNSARDNVPSNINKMGGDHRDSLVMSASVKDLMVANSSEEQGRLFQANRAESALMLKIFVENNLPPEKRAAFIAKHSAPVEESSSPVAPTSTANYGFDDDDD
jgi:hypothetical protein